MNPFGNLVNVVNNVDFNTIINLITSSDVQAKLLPVKIAFLAISAILFGLIVFTQMKVTYLQLLFINDLQQFVRMKSYSQKKLTKQWDKIIGRLDAGAESDYKLAVIEADSLMDDSLKKMGYDGLTLEEKLGKLSSVVLPNIDELYEAHHLRNNIVHDPNYRFTLEDAKKALEVYGKSFRDLQILEK